MSWEFKSSLLFKIKICTHTHTKTKTLSLPWINTHTHTCTRVCIIKDSKLCKDDACSDLGWNRSQLAPPRVCCTEWRPVFDVVALLCCVFLVLGTWRLVSCSLWSWGCLSIVIPKWKRTQASSLLHQQSAIKKCSNSLHKLSSYSDLDYQLMNYGQMFCTLLSFSSLGPCSCV